MKHVFLAYVFVITALSCLVAEEPKSEKGTTSTKKEKLSTVWETTKSSSDRLKLLFTPGKVRAEQLQLGVTPRFAALSQKLQQGMKDNPTVLAKLILTSKSGKPLDYDPAFGITKDEYKEYLALTGKHQLIKLEDIELTIEHKDKNVIKVSGFPGIDAMEIDAEKLTIKTKYGTATGGNEFLPNDNQKLTGKMNGYNWRPGLAALASGESQKFTIGQIVDSGQVFMDIRVKKSVADKNYLADYYIRFDGLTKK